MRAHNGIGAGAGLLLALALTIAGCGADPRPADPDRTVAAPRVGNGSRTLLAGEHAVLTGRIRPAGRTVELQRKTGSGWERVGTARTADGGAYTFDTELAGGTETFRVTSAATSTSGRRTSRSVELRTAQGRVTLDAPGVPVGQADGDVGSSSTTYLPVNVRLTPARSVPVQVERRSSTGWAPVSTGTTTRRGTGALQLPASAAGQQLRAVVLAGNGARPVTSAPVSTDSPRLTWRDEFTSEATYQKQWRTRLQEYGGGRLCAKPDPAMAQLRNGVVRLRAARDNPRVTKTCPYGTFKNAMIATRVDGYSNLETRYGTFAARIRFQSGQGAHGAFWLQGPSVTGTEIDAAEYFGDGRPDGGLSASVHHTVGSEVTTAGGIYPSGPDLLGTGQTPSSGFHVYAVTWSPDDYVFRVDGRVVRRTSKPYVSRADQFLVLSLLTSDWELGSLDLGAMRRGSVMDVDWVRVWQ